MSVWVRRPMRLRKKEGHEEIQAVIQGSPRARRRRPPLGPGPGRAAGGPYGIL